MEDYYQFNMHHTYHAPANKRFIFRSRILYPLAFIACAALFAFGFGDIDTSFRFAFSVMLTFYALVLFIFHDALIKRRVRKNIARCAQDGKMIDEGTRTYRFEDDQYISATKTQTVISAYSELTRVDEGKHAVYLYEGAIRAHIFPYHIFTSEEERTSFISFARGKTGECRE